MGLEIQTRKTLLDPEGFSEPHARSDSARIPSLTQEVPFTRGRATGLGLNVLHIIEVGFQLLISELVQEWVREELDTIREISTVKATRI